MRGQGDRMQRLWEQLPSGGLRELLHRLRPASRADFLTELHDSGPAATLGSPKGLRAGWAYLGQEWPDTVNAVAQPESLPSVVERRTRQRVSPVAPWATSATAGLGSVVVVAGNNAAWLEGLGVVGVVALTGGIAAALWRPRTRRADRTHRVQGAEALCGRAETVAADLTRNGADGALLRTSDRLLAEVHGTARTLERVEEEARASGLLGKDGRVRQEPDSPGAQRLADELLHLRAEALHDVLRLQVLAQQQAAQLRIEDRATYRQLLDDLDD